MNPAALTHRRRLEACLAGTPIDRVPVALWRHFPVDDQTPAGLAAAAAHFQETYDFDLVKVTPASSFCLKDWGAGDQWRGNPEGTRDYTIRPIRQPEDWLTLPVLDPRRGALGAQLDCLEMLVKRFEPDTPVLQTIFSPLSQAKNLVGPDQLIVHLRRWPEAVLAGLRTITATTRAFMEAMLALQPSGIFYAVQHASFGLLTPAEFETFGRAFDLPILEQARPLWLNMLHLHGEEVMFDAVTDYPVQVLNWHDRHTAPNLAQARERFAGVLCGGLRKDETMVLGDPQSVRAEAFDAVRQTQGTRFILGTGCVTPTVAPRANLLAARQSVEAAAEGG
jgi:uroporphyrinogen decarboxylase